MPAQLRLLVRVARPVNEASGHVGQLQLDRCECSLAGIG
jgi:hypothetical protein